MRVFPLGFALVVAFASTSCGPKNEENLKNAAIAAPVAIAMVGVYRAVTNECWGRCSTGYLCNEESGLCELGECLPGCEVGSHCVRDPRGNTSCVSDTGVTIHFTRPPPGPDAGSVADAATADAESTADAAADASAAPSEEP